MLCTDLFLTVANCFAFLKGERWDKIPKILEYVNLDKLRADLSQKIMEFSMNLR